MRHILGRSQAELGIGSDFLLAKNIRSPLRPPGSGPICPLAFQLPRPQKLPPSGEPGPPSGPARRGRARQAAPACMRESHVAAQPGRAWLWRNSRNPYDFIGRTGYLWPEPQKSPLLGNTMILQRTNSLMVEPQTTRARSSGQ